MTDETEQQQKHQTHYSAMQLHRKCPQAWYYRYGLGLTQAQRQVAPERDLGSWWSALRAAEALERGRALDSLRARPRKMTPVDGGPEFDQATVTVADVFSAADDWWKDHRALDTGDGSAEEMWVTRLGEGLPDRLAGLYQRWLDRWERERRTERPLGVEVFWQRPLPIPANDGEWGGPVSVTGAPRLVLIGFIDEVYLDSERNMVVVRDDKTSKALGTQSALDDMMDSQLQVYAWGASPTVEGWGSGPIRALAYDRSRSVRPKTPVLTKSGSLSKTTTDFDLRAYTEWAGAGQAFEGLKKDGSGAGVYEPEQAVIDRLTQPTEVSKWFQRTLVPVNRNIVKAHLRAAVDTAADQWLTTERAKVAGEAARNMSKDNCRFCDYAALCRAQMVGGPDGEYDFAEFGLARREVKSRR